MNSMLFEGNIYISPETGRPLKVGGKTYKQLLKVGKVPSYSKQPKQTQNKLLPIQNSSTDNLVEQNLSEEEEEDSPDESESSDDESDSSIVIQKPVLSRKRYTMKKPAKKSKTNKNRENDFFNLTKSIMEKDLTKLSRAKNFDKSLRKIISKKLISEDDDSSSESEQEDTDDSLSSSSEEYEY